MKFFESWRFAFIIVTLGYTFKENHICDYIDGDYIDAYSTLDEALDRCNSNVQCKCIDHRDGGSTYWTYTSGAQGDNPYFDAWVITAIWY